MSLPSHELLDKAETLLREAQQLQQESRFWAKLGRICGIASLVLLAVILMRVMY